MIKFVNPYTFLPLPKKVKREQPHMHDGSGASDQILYTGKFEVEWQLKSPLLLPENAEEEGWMRVVKENIAEITVPGSSVKGAMRSLHEAMFMGCMSVLDLDYTPVYREAAIKGQRAMKSDSDWRIGIVEEVESSGKPISMRVTEKEANTIWVNAEGLRRVAEEKGKIPQTGDIIRFHRKDTRSKKKNGRKKISRPASFSQYNDGILENVTDQDYVVIISDGGTRKSDKDWYWACKKIGPNTKSLTIDENAWKNFLIKVDGTEDKRREKNEKNDSGNGGRIEVRKNDEVIGKRIAQNGIFKKGDTIWVKVDDKSKKVIDLSYSTIWRRVAKKENGDVMKMSDLFEDLDVTPCDPNEKKGVCLSCSIFGAEGPKNEKGADGLGYAGHVRFGSLELVERLKKTGVEIIYDTVMPLSAPRPSNGQFYMENPGSDDLGPKPTEPQYKNEETTSHWDRRDIEDFDRKPAGRKFYWNHDPLRLHKTYRKYSGQIRYEERIHYKGYEGANPKMVSRRPIVLVKDDVILKGEVTFDQLTSAQLISLRYILDPVSLREAFNIKGANNSVIRLGGGKPLGFGAAVPKIKNSKVTQSRNRYISFDSEIKDNSNETCDTNRDRILGAIINNEDDFVKILRRRIVCDEDKDDLTKNITMMIRIMDLEALGADQNYVSYPPNATWDKYGTKEFHESYNFFSETQGAARSEKDNRRKENSRNKRDKRNKKNKRYWGKWMPLPVLEPLDYPHWQENRHILRWYKND
jgi:CRISPR-associated protein